MIVKKNLNSNDLICEKGCIDKDIPIVYYISYYLFILFIYFIFII